MMASMWIMIAFAAVFLVAGVIGRGVAGRRGRGWRVGVTVVVGSGAIVWTGVLLPGLNAEGGAPPEVAGALVSTVLWAVGGMGCLWLPLRWKRGSAGAGVI